MEEKTELRKLSEGERKPACEREENMAALLNETVAKADLYVRKSYLTVLNQAQILPLGRKESQLVPGASLRLIKIDSFVFEKDTSVSQKLRNIYGAIERQGLSAVLLLEGKKDKVNIYLGVSAGDYDSAASGFKTLLNSFNGTFPGCGCKNIKFESANQILNEVFPDNEELSLAAVSGMAEEANDSAAEQAEKLNVVIDGMRGKPFSMILLAQYLDNQELALMRKGLESLYTQISPFQRQDVTMSQSETENYGINISRTISQSLTVSSGLSYGVTETSGTGKSTQTAPDNSGQKKHQSALQAAGAFLSIAGTNLLVPGGGNILQSLFYGQAVSNLLGNIEEASGKAPRPDLKSVTESEHTDTGRSVTGQESEARADSEGHSDGYNAGASNTYGKTMLRSCVNKSVAGLMEQIERQLKQIDRLEHEGAFKVAAYFVAGDKETAASAANLYRSVVSSARRSARCSPIYQWADRENVRRICDYLIRGLHPVFSFGEESGFPEVTAAQPVGLLDIPAYFALPEKSLPGFEVTDHAAFARDVRERLGESADRTDRMAVIGCVCHMGKEEPHTEVSLDLDELTKHLFVSGATGVGKSNFCYQLIDQAVDRGVHMLIIEPAKGEYARVFGGREGFYVYGTNLKFGPVLHINPFAYPEGIHVVEHIDRLLDIFNAAWPMYSAMPAILKDAIEEIYEDRGFDMLLGDKPQFGVFPCFTDLLEKLPEVINRSAYSGEVKGNYVGALVTRVKSLTNGIYGSVFGRAEIGDAGIFDKNVIIDISRVGSEETKSLIMGVLVMRLSEYRMCSGDMNSQLKHLTLLEEAHHLLRRQNGSSVEGANMKAASVEMITNAIAEMRTYGEGFIIADQSPSVMDQSVIRNTQTKVFFMLPDREDRRTAGESIALSDRQQQEMARLRPGAAVVFQNRWTEPVLCKIKYFEPERACPCVCQPEDYYARSRSCIGQCLAILLKNRLSDEASSSVDEAVIRQIKDDLSCFGGERAKAVDRTIKKYLSGEPIPTELCKIAEEIETLVGFGKIFARCRACAEIKEWADQMGKEIKNTAFLTEEETRLLISVGIQTRIKRNPSYKKLYVRYLVYCMDNPAGGKEGTM